MTKENKERLQEAIRYVSPLACIFVGLLQSHTGTDFIIIGCSLYLGYKINYITD